MAQQTAKGGLSLTAPSTEACWMPLGPQKFCDAARRVLLFGMDTAALPVWDEEYEAEQSEGRPYRCSYGRHKQRSDRRMAKEQGLDENRWFGNVENTAAQVVGRETVQYLSNIYKYFIAYSLAAQLEDADQTGNDSKPSAEPAK